MDKIPFTIYDIFGYVIPGTILTFSINYFFPELRLFGFKEPTLIEGVIAFFLLYVVGHLIATPSALLLETLFVKKYLKDPQFLLLNPRGDVKGFKKLFPGHFLPIEKISKKTHL